MNMPKLSRETKGFGAMIIILAVLMLSSALPQLLDSKVDAPPLIGIDGREFELGATVEELYNLGLVLQDKDGNIIVPSDWQLEKKTVVDQDYILSISDSDLETTAHVRLFNPSSKQVSFSDSRVYSFTCNFSSSGSGAVPITIWSVDYKGMSAKTAMESVAAIGGDLTLDEFHYERDTNRCDFSNGPYKYHLEFSNGGTLLSTMTLSKYVQVDYSK